ncbi:acetyltransferase [Cyanobium sp. FGCU-52]|nr:acetyltransferase [Cyanobium sp. FGCU52]
MFLKLRHDEASSLVEVLDLPQLFDPFQDKVQARLHGGEELQDPADYAKSDLVFPSGEALPRCWVDAQYRH